MKKKSIMLFAAGMLLTIMPMEASAVSFEKVGDSYCNSADISGGANGTANYGTFKKGDICYKYTDEEKGIKEWTYYLTPSQSLTTIYYEIQPSENIEIQNIAANKSDFLPAATKKTETGEQVVLFSNNPTGVSSGKRVLLFTVTTKDLAVEKCFLNISPLQRNCVVIGDIYLDRDGNSVSKADYDKVCGNVTPTPTDPMDPDEPNNPQTGSVIPYVAVGGGLLAIAGVYLFSRKSNKMYKL